MSLDELIANETSDEVMQKYYDMIKDAYNKGEEYLVLKKEELTLTQYGYLRDVKGYDVYTHSDTGKVCISGW